MKTIFTSSTNPGLFSKAIAAHERSPWTHVCVQTDVVLPTGEPLVIHASIQGVSLSPMSLVLGTKNTKVYEDDREFDWGLALSFLHAFHGFQHYGWAQTIGKFLRFFSIPEPKWIVERYASQAHCAGFIILKNQARGLMRDLDPHRTGPGTLERYMRENKNFREGSLLD